ncbi:DUF86 domain-containing protein [Synechococcus sp. 1G10]|uniref:HepT-like ribonuclease domain-containing protein n=1 Tax=Synechococcus sp. 1G10 TaxID=2025605 RepID=UPI000B99B3EA|nr:HepT-like ribonuclease domain-containing protein [Synechococcus sp. 1G10]
MPWRRIAGLRDVLAHAYVGLEGNITWQIVSESIPALPITWLSASGVHHTGGHTLSPQQQP